MAPTLFDIIQEVTAQVPGCLHTSVVDGATGLSLASVSDGDPLDAAGADAYHNDLYRLTELALEGLPLSGTAKGIVLTSRESTFISAPVEQTGYLWLVVTKRATAVGFTQAIMRKYVGRIEESLQALI